MVPVSPPRNSTESLMTASSRGGVAVDGSPESTPPAKAEGAPGAAEVELAQVQLRVSADGSLPSEAPPAPFLVGVSLSTWQNSGDAAPGGRPESNWGQFAPGTHCGCIPRIRSGKKLNGRYWPYRRTVGSGPDFWNRYEEDVKAAKALGCNSFRFSLEWARIEPQRGAIDEAALTRFGEIFDCIRAHGMEPMPTLYHFVYPAWFLRLGGFARDANIALFVAFCELIFDRFHTKAKLWATINEANVQVFFGYICGNHVPGDLLALHKAGRVFCNLLVAHARVYRALKAMPGGAEAQIGIVHNYMWFESKGRSPIYAFTRYLSRRLNHWYGNQLVLDFFTTGTFKWEHPLWGHFEHTEAELPRTDWIGINYYTRSLHNPVFVPTCRKGEYMTDMPYRAYATGLYDAVQHMSQLNVPMYITETGIADRDDTHREHHIQQYMQQIERCVQDGLDLRGVTYWTLTDNFEWDQGWTMQFGLYEFDPTTKERTLRVGARIIKKIYRVSAACRDDDGPVPVFETEMQFLCVGGARQCINILKGSFFCGATFSRHFPAKAAYSTFVLICSTRANSAGPARKSSPSNLTAAGIPRQPGNPCSA